MMAPTPTENLEEERIREVYSNRNPKASRYSLFNPAQLIATQQLEAKLLNLLQRYQRRNLESQKIMEIGCGSGYWLRRFIDWGARPANLAGIDLLPDRISEALTICPRGVNLKCGSALHTEFAEETFDMICQFTVFTSILEDSFKRALSTEMLRILKPNGLIIWYDYHMNNPGNKDVRGIRRAEIQSLFPGCTLALQRITLAPPVSRKLAPYSPLFCLMLSKVPFLCTHYLGGIWRAYEPL